MVVEALGHQLDGERIFLAAGLLDLGALVLEPDFDLLLVEAELLGELLPARLREVSVLGELALEPGELFPAEGCPRPLLVWGDGRFFAGRSLHSPRAWSCKKAKEMRRSDSA